MVPWEDKQIRQTFSQTHQEKYREWLNKKNIIEKGNVTTNDAEIQRIIKDYYEQWYDNKTDNLGEMDRFLKSSIFQDWTSKK